VLEPVGQGSKPKYAQGTAKGVVPGPDVVDVLAGIPPSQRLRRFVELRRLASVTSVGFWRSRRETSAGKKLVFGTDGRFRGQSIGRRVSGVEGSLPSGFQPHVLPEEVAVGLTTSVGRAIAAKPLQMDGGVEATPCPGFVDGVTGFVSDCTDAETLPTERKHLGHERQALNAAVLVQRGEDFLFAANFHKVAGAKSG
jgi:hypothetical protein